MIETIHFKGKDYPVLQSRGFASQYAFPFAEKMCQGNGFDIGYSQREWKLPGAVGIDVDKICGPDGDEREMLAQNADNFAGLEGADYIFSSHCLEHLNDWVGVLDYWKTKLRPGGVMFLYLPDCDYQEYWQPMHNRKHVNWLRPYMLTSYFNSGGWRNTFVTGHDLNYSFYAVSEKI